MGQGRRQDLLDVYESIKKQKTIHEITEEHPVEMMKFSTGILRVHHILTPARHWRMQIEAVIGAPGVGKTTSLLRKHTNAFWWSGTKWFDGYNGETVVIMDEFHGNLPFTLFKRLCDPSPLDVEIKGGSARFIAHRLVFVANAWPHEWYKYEDLGTDSWPAVRRRLGRVWHATDTAWVDVTRDGGYGDVNM